ncbi:lysine exporter LysO family protein [Aminipila terrae]|uniref:LysO family transporter n=1 Tax=Aminipila terrae TaxID=2697030 RepID=A0A6P1MNN5_9FIRM|nr:lysine exporter LysO family protein [Aminipila terrae]QHI73286.1 LysO family transporter [Aminipila terrae]
MTKLIITFLTLGVVSGYFFIPDFIITHVSGNLLIVGLCVMLFFVGMDLGRTGTVVENFKKVGIRILVFPLASIIGCLTFAAVGSLFLPMTAKETMAVASGFGWYTLAPVMLADCSAELSAISFLHNVMREMVGIMIIPIVAKYIGYIESCSVPGAAAADVCLPIIEKSTDSDTTVYAFVMGVVLSTTVPVLVGAFISMGL